MLEFLIVLSGGICISLFFSLPLIILLIIKKILDREDNKK